MMPAEYPTTRTCRDCREDKPLSGLVTIRGKVQTLCRECNSRRSSEWGKRNRLRKPVEYSPNELRRCSGCLLEKSIAEFPMRFGSRHFRCNICLLSKSSEWAANNRERSNATKRAWAERNPERNVAAKVAYARSERGEEKRRAWKQRNRKYLNDLTRKQFAENPAAFNERIARRKERERAAEGIFIDADERVMFEAQRGRCANPACLADITTGKFHADHIKPLIHGGTHWPDNRQLLCARCNHIKGARLPGEWAAIISDPALFKQKWGIV